MEKFEQFVHGATHSLDGLGRSLLSFIVFAAQLGVVFLFLAYWFTFWLELWAGYCRSSYWLLPVLGLVFLLLVLFLFLFSLGLSIRKGVKFGSELEASPVADLAGALPFIILLLIPLLAVVVTHRIFGRTFHYFLLEQTQAVLGKWLHWT